MGGAGKKSKFQRLQRQSQSNLPKAKDITTEQSPTLPKVLPTTEREIQSTTTESQPTVSTPTENSLWRKDVRAIFEKGYFSLFITFLIGGLQIGGVVDMLVAHLLIVVAWLIAVITVITSESVAAAPRKKKIATTIVTGFIAGFLLLVVDLLMINKKVEIDMKAETDRLALQQQKTPIEKKLRTFLVPSTESMATNPCPDVPSNAMIVHYGDNASYTTKNDITLLSVDDKPTLTVKKTINGLLVNLTLYGKDGNEIATIRDNKFVGKVNDNLDVQSPDPHSIDIFDNDNNQHLFHIRYLNPTTIDVSGVFYFPNRKLPLIIDKSGVSAFGYGIEKVCDSNFGKLSALNFE